MTLSSTPDVLRDAILRAWECAFPEAGVIYLGGPITTGPRYVQSLVNVSRASISSERIIEENTADLLSAARLLRQQRIEMVIEPASLRVPGWSQPDYYALWQTFIERYARLIVFMPEWEFSLGCALEFAHAIQHNIPVETLSGVPIRAEEGIALLVAARDVLRAQRARVSELARLANGLNDVAARLKEALRPAAHASTAELRKDESLDRLADRGINVAQFVSFEPIGERPRQAYSRICGREANRRFNDLHSAIEALLASSADKSINVRSYEPHSPRSREFIYGLKDVDTAAQAVHRLTAEGLYTIVNETIDVRDGGVSGVLMGDVVEFAPDDTPRCVEKPGTASLPRSLGREILATVYSVAIDFPVPFYSRLEFSLHPRPRGWKQSNIVAWELSEQESTVDRPQIEWPNNFSRMIGDKTFGLLVAHHLGLRVPLTTVVNRRIASFSFGRPTNWTEQWIRTAPHEQMPGLFTTHRGWIDPFALVGKEDPDGTAIASVLSQAGVFPHYSGALIVAADGEPIVEGCSGSGEDLMLGNRSPEELPAEVLEAVEDLRKRAEATLGPVRFEWVHDGKHVWIVQFHRGITKSTHSSLMPGDAEQWLDFDVSQGLPVLRNLLSDLPRNTGLVLTGRVGLTSHIADAIRKARVPAKMAN